MPSWRTFKAGATSFVRCLEILSNTVAKIAAQYIGWFMLTLRYTSSLCNRHDLQLAINLFHYF